MSLNEFLHGGGFAMYPLLIFSIILWAIAFDRFFFLRSFSKKYKRVHADAQTALVAHHYDDLKLIFKQAPAAIARPHEVLLENAVGSREQINEKVTRRLTETQNELKKNIWIIGTIATSAPFVGLFGTVMGIMESFKAIGASGKSGFSIVAVGISESLIATAAGILVAVVAVIFYNYLQTKINQVNLDFKNKLQDFAEVLLSSNKAGK